MFAKPGGMTSRVWCRVAYCFINPLNLYDYDKLQDYRDVQERNAQDP